ncbi:malate dehydrogenase (quinone) [Marinobacter lacisalsi]|uniref:Probable malate:quinone oxidoreductase n=1 Tax=Marinobacter lacisalsi TaxID=475979 RepID=A0ABV8QPF7_9GAMM
MSSQHTDVLLIGGGVMSVTLASLIAELDTSRTITVVEQSSQLAPESSDAWNNAGTGHAGYCELNYTPEQPDGTVSIDRALTINEQFEVSLQFWSSLVASGRLPAPENFIRNVPHLSWVQGQEACRFLKNRHSALQEHPLFADMEFSDQSSTLNQWLPLVTRSRSVFEPAAATRVAHGSDVNFGALTRLLGRSLAQRDNCEINLGWQVTDIERPGDHWKVTLWNPATSETRELTARFLFIGAGGASLSLLQKAGVREARGYGGFPVSGLWLACEDEALATAHNAKVYSQAPVGAPPMSVPHLDTRYIDGKAALLFGPFAGFTTRFLKRGSPLDLPASVRRDNLRPMMDVARGNWPLTRYLIREALSSRESRLAQLGSFLPEVNPDAWKLVRAGQRVQIIKPDHNRRGTLEFGTEVLTSGDRSLAALLGASPGASTCVPAMLDVIERCLPDLVTGERRQTLQAMIPSYGQSLREDHGLLADVRNHTLSTLGLTSGTNQPDSERSLYA